MAFTRYGDQPAIRYMYEQGWSYKTLAEKISVPYMTFNRGLRGGIALHPKIIKHLPEILNASAEDLFTPEALAVEFRLQGRARVGL